jgi:hypothetical protein
MCAGISLSWRDFPECLIEEYRLRDRIVVRAEGADWEIRFLYRDPGPLLPVWHGRQLKVYTWGSLNTRSKLPRTGWTKLESLKTGLWEHLRPESVEIPATLGLDHGIWYQVQGAIQGLLLPDERGNPHVYMVTEPASHYYNVITRSEWMPVFMGWRI